MDQSRRASFERYNPITGAGIPVTPARANTSAIFGNSPSSIEYMFIPPSATTRPSIPSHSSQKRRSLSRESLRRSFPSGSEDPPETDECSSVSDISECGSEGEHPKSNRKTTYTLPKTRKPLSRTSSSRLPNSTPKPGVMKRAQSFTRETTRRPSCGTTSGQHVMHSESDLTNQTRGPGVSVTSKIPRKPVTNAGSTGLQSSRIPLKRRDVNSNIAANGPGNESTVIKRTAPEPQSSGIHAKQTNVKKRTANDSRRPSGTEESIPNTDSSSGIPVKSTGSRSQYHPGGSRIPQSKQSTTHVNTDSKLTGENEREKESLCEGINDVKAAVQAGKQLLKREGTGDELRATNPDGTKSKLPRKSNIPRANVPKPDQYKLTNNENVRGKSTTERSKSNIKNEEGTQCSKTEKLGATKLPVKQRQEVNTADCSTVSCRMSQRTDSSHSDTDSVSSKEDAPAVFCLSRENSRSKIPIRSRKGRVVTKSTGVMPCGNEVSISKAAEVAKKSAGKEPEGQQTNNASSDEFIGKPTVSLSKWQPEQETETKKPSIVTKTDDAAVPEKNSEPDEVRANEEKNQGKDTFSRTEEREIRETGKKDGIKLDNDTRELTNEHHVSTTTKKQSSSQKVDVLQEYGGVVTKMNNGENPNVEKPSMTGNRADVANTGIVDQTGDSSCTRDCSPACFVDSTTSADGHKTFLSRKNGEVVSGEIDEIKTGTEGGSSSKRLSEKDIQVRSTSTENLGPDIPQQALSNIIQNGIHLERKVPQSLSLKDCSGNIGLNKEYDVKPEMKCIEKENHYALLDSERSFEEENPHFSESDTRLVVSSAEKDKGPENKFDTCFECRVEQNEVGIEELLKGDEVGGDSCSKSDVQRYPTFISPRKSLVLCKYHEKLKNKGGVVEDLEKPMVLTPQPAVKNDHLPEVCPLALPKGTVNDVSECQPQEVKLKNERKSLKNTADDIINNSISKREVEAPMVNQPGLKNPKKKNHTSVRDRNPSTINSEPVVQSSGQRSTVDNSTSDKNLTNSTVQKGSDSPLLALSRDKKFVSGENLAPRKNPDAMMSALSLEWDDVGTELSPPNVSEEDEDILEPGSKQRVMDREDDRRPSVKLMDTNEALDKLKVIQSLIMKEAENRKKSAESRKGSDGSAGRFGVSEKRSGEGQIVSKNNGKYGKYVSSTSEEKQLTVNQMNPKDVMGSEQVSTTPEVPRREVSSPTIWDRIDNNATSQDQTTELLNETLAKLKASPQLSGNAFARRTISTRSLPGSRQASKERLLNDAERPVYVYTSNWMNTSGKNSVASSLSLRSANRSLPNSRQNLTKDPFNALKRSESASGRMEKEHGKRTESKEKKEYRLSNFDEMLSDDGTQELKSQKRKDMAVSPVSEKTVNDNRPSKKPTKISKRKKKSKNTAEKMKNVPPSEISMEDLAEGKTNCQCVGKNCVIS